MKLLLSMIDGGKSRADHRNIRERLAQAAPFLTFLTRDDPYMVISEGRLFWIADAYTVSDRYPYSQPVGSQQQGSLNYIRNSVKAIVDAYHGSVQLYISDEKRPADSNRARIFPGLLRPLSEMPADLRTHLRYPEDIFKIQTAVFSTWHMDQPQVFYNKEDQWSVAAMSRKQGSAEAQTMEPYYTIMKPPGEKSEEFIRRCLSRRKTGQFSGLDGGARRRRALRQTAGLSLPQAKTDLRAQTIVARVNQDPEISRQLTLWNQRGSQAIARRLNEYASSNKKIAQLPRAGVRRCDAPPRRRRPRSLAAEHGRVHVEAVTLHLGGDLQLLGPHALGLGLELLGITAGLLDRPPPTGSVNLDGQRLGATQALPQPREGEPDLLGLRQRGGGPHAARPRSASVTRAASTPPPPHHVVREAGSRRPSPAGATNAPRPGRRPGSAPGRPAPRRTVAARRATSAWRPRGLSWRRISLSRGPPGEQRVAIGELSSYRLLLAAVLEHPGLLDEPTTVLGSGVQDRVEAVLARR